MALKFAHAIPLLQCMLSFSHLNSFSVSWTIKLAFSLGACNIVTIHQECGESFVKFVKFCKVCSFVLLVIGSSKCGLFWCTVVDNWSLQLNSSSVRVHMTLIRNKARHNGHSHDSVPQWTKWCSHSYSYALIPGGPGCQRTINETFAARQALTLQACLTLS